MNLSYRKQILSVSMSLQVVSLIQSVSCKRISSHTSSLIKRGKRRRRTRSGKCWYPTLYYSCTQDASIVPWRKKNFSNHMQ